MPEPCEIVGTAVKEAAADHGVSISASHRFGVTDAPRLHHQTQRWQQGQLFLHRGAIAGAARNLAAASICSMYCTYAVGTAQLVSMSVNRANACRDTMQEILLPMSFYPLSFYPCSAILEHIRVSTMRTGWNPSGSLAAPPVDYGTVRADDNGKPVSAAAFVPTLRAFGDRLGKAMAALVASSPSEEPNRVGFRLYERFQLDGAAVAEGWSERRSCRRIGSGQRGRSKPSRGPRSRGRLFLCKMRRASGGDASRGGGPSERRTLAD